MSFATQETSQAAGAPLELYKFAMGTAQTWWLTSSDAAIAYLADTYVPTPITRSTFRPDNEAEGGTLTITLPRTHPLVLPFVGYSPEPPMTLTIYQKHQGDAEVIVRWIGTVSSVLFRGGTVTLTCLPSSAALRINVPRNTCQAQCNWALYSAECGITSSAYVISGLVTVIAADTIQATVFASKPSGWLNNGWVERANGERRWVVAHAGNVVTLMSPFLTLAVGETVSAFAGCDRTEYDCLNKFNNAERFLGWPRVPTRNPFISGVT